MLHLSDIKLPEGVEIPELAQGPEHDHAIVAIHVIKATATDEETEVADAEVPVVADDKDKDKDKDKDA
jgi:large subunit ribosomal protein L25